MFFVLASDIDEFLSASNVENKTSKKIIRTHPYHSNMAFYDV